MCLSLSLIKFCVCPSFPFGIESGIWDLIVLIPVHCLSIYFKVPQYYYRTFQGGTSVVVPPSYKLCLYEYGVQQYGYLNSRCQLCLLFRNLNRKKGKKLYCCRFQKR